MLCFLIAVILKISLENKNVSYDCRVVDTYKTTMKAFGISFWSLFWSSNFNERRFGLLIFLPFSYLPINYLPSPMLPKGSGVGDFHSIAFVLFKKYTFHFNKRLMAKIHCPAIIVLSRGVHNSFWGSTIL